MSHLVLAVALAGGVLFSMSPHGAAPQTAILPILPIGGGMANGAYECWAFSSPRPLLNFTVTGPARYESPDGAVKGGYTLDGAGRLTFSGGPLDGAMPEGFTARYEVRRNAPTVSFIGTSGSEAAFCELT